MQYFGARKDELAVLEVAFYLRNFSDPAVGPGPNTPKKQTNKKARTSYVFQSLSHV